MCIKLKLKKNTQLAKSIFVFLLIFFLCSALKSQQKFTFILLDSVNNDAVAFAAIVNSSNQLLTTSGIDGKAEINVETGTFLRIKCTGYKTYSFITNETYLVVKLSPLTYELGDITITAGENPAHRLIRNAEKNRDKNNPRLQVRHCYKAYNKLIFKADEDSLDKISLTKKENDTSFWEMRKFFNSQHIFLTESLTELYHSPPDKTTEKIIANRVSGFENPLFSILATELQSFGYYKDEIKLLGISYVNPISKNSYSRYLFLLSDTSYDGKDTLFTISFEPRKSKSFKGLKGSLVIHTDGYALKSIKAQPVSYEGMRIFINQLYEKIEGKQWFPVQLNAKMFLPDNVKTGDIILYGDNKGIISDFRLEDDCIKKKTDEIELEIEPTIKDTSIVRLKPFNNRFYDKKDSLTYKTVDSVGKKAHFDKRLNNLNQLMSGKLPVKFLNIDLNRLFNYNRYEGLRLGLGLSTNHKISQRHSLGGYFAYGFKDKAFKYGGNLNLLLWPRKQTDLKISYSNDLIEAGAPADFMQPKSFLSPASARNFYIRKYDFSEKWEAVFGTRMLKHFHVYGFYDTQVRTPKYSYQYYFPLSENSYYLPTKYFLTEAGAILRFGFREKFILAGNKLLSKGTAFPYITVKYTRSLNNLWYNDYNFYRVDVKFEKKFKIRKLGISELQVHYGKITGTVPYSYLSTLIPSREQYALSVPFSFETMNMNEFLANEYAMVFFSHNFTSNLFYNLKNQPQLEFFTNVGWGKLSNNNAIHSGIDYKVPSQGYYESGIRVHSLIKSSFSRIGISFGYRYGPYTLPKFIDNTAIKIITGIIID